MNLTCDREANTLRRAFFPDADENLLREGINSEGIHFVGNFMIDTLERFKPLADHSSRPISVLPNAGLPENIGGQPHYPLTPEELARYLSTFVSDYGVSIVGCCCGTTPDHLAAVVEASRTNVNTPQDVHIRI